MATLAVELNDAGIQIRGGTAPGEAERFSSPGYALVDGTSILTGTEAAACARLKPRLVHNRFWSELDTSPLPRPFPTHLRRADLAHAHLSSVWQKFRPGVDRVILAVPGSYTEAQLGLLLGIAQACEMQVCGLIDSALASAVNGFSGQRLLHLDLQLHRAVLSELVQERELVRRHVEVSSHTGFLPLQERCVNTIAECFVHQTRFDPLYAAATEQLLYERLPGILEQLRVLERAPIELQAAGKTHVIELSRQQLVAAVEPDYAGMMQLVSQLRRVGEHATLLLSHRLAAMPDLRERLEETPDTSVISLKPGMAAYGALNREKQIRVRGDALRLVTRLPLDAGIGDGSRPQTKSGLTLSASQVAVLPTHLLHQGRAYCLPAAPFSLGTNIPDGSKGINLTEETAGISRHHCSIQRLQGRLQVEDHSSHGSFLNDRRIEGVATASVGDRLRLGSPGVEMHFIRVADPDGTTQD